MTSENAPNVTDALAPAKGKVIGGFAGQPQIQLIDLAVVALRARRPDLKRAHFVVEAAVKEAKAVLKKQRETDAAA